MENGIIIHWNTVEAEANRKTFDLISINKSWGAKFEIGSNYHEQTKDFYRHIHSIENWTFDELHSRDEWVLIRIQVTLNAHKMFMFMGVLAVHMLFEVESNMEVKSRVRDQSNQNQTKIETSNKKKSHFPITLMPTTKILRGT